MIYLRCPFCKKVSGEVEGTVVLKEPIDNYYDIRMNEFPSNTFNTVEAKIVNGLTYFPHEICYELHMDVEARRKKVMEGLKLGR